VVKFLRALGLGLFTLAGWAYTTLFFLVLKALMLPVGAAALGWQALGLDRVARALPWLMVPVSQAGLFFVCSDAGRAWLVALPLGQWWWPLLFVALLGLFFLSGTLLGAAPKTLPDIETSVATRWPERRWAHRMRVPLDAIFVRLTFSCALVAAPTFLAALVPGWGNLWLLLVVHTVALATIASTFELVDHTTMHNGLFSPTGLSGFDRGAMQLLSFAFDWVLTPICNRVPNWYRVQHLAVHHVENGSAEDSQSILAEDRTSHLAFCRAALSFGVDYVTGAGVIPYLRRHGRSAYLAQLLRGLAVYVVMLLALALLNWRFALFVWLARFFSGAMAAALNFTWHALADPRDLANTYRNTVNSSLATAPYNLGQGAHIEHHLNPGRHWSKLHADAEATQATHRAQGALELDPVLGERFLALMWLRRFDALAQGMAIPGEAKDPAALARLLEERSRPSSLPPRSALLAGLDRALGHLGAALQ